MRPLAHGFVALLTCAACGLDLTPKPSDSRGSVLPGGTEGNRLAGMTDEHNAIRAEVAAAPPLPELAWSADLAEVAQTYAEHLSASCDLVHSGGPYGENLAFFGGQPATAQTVVDLWASEKSCWTYGLFERGDACSSACKGSGGCGHYTQMVWRNTKVVGCGVANCATGDGEIWVCNYDPPGNFVGEAPY